MICFKSLINKIIYRLTLKAVGGFMFTKFLFKNYKFCISLFCIVLLFSCASKPNVDDGKKYVEKLIKKNANGLIELIQFKKTNAISGENNGIKFYNMKYQATIKFKDDCWYFYKYESDKFKAKPFESSKDNYWYSYQYKLSGAIKKNKGDTTTINGELKFLKTEKGWKVD